ncbi:hypothetical protein [Asticcacaulis benevestitus]|uniref:Uncharacterized protein n=1 Tax=Asticcacaulis benevestitus DSM 16100 = ATCC BAA-896 TaxID=1121022 RepID=V4NMF2_9CAUL|nr:hypothetical protein [Asticcacaulis benevestitus]ESQ82987.1 hypothetical protein ABENE_20475 [Asticcacaulis benevestitus DSM 16100 = ATCC BAA-896]
MYYEAVKSAFRCFPLDPPRNLAVGDYVRIALGGRVHHQGNLAKLLGVEIEFDEHIAEIEYMSDTVLKAGMGGSAPGTEANISFSNAPGLYLKGIRKVRRVRNLDSLFKALSSAKLDWSFHNRIVVETHYVENAELFCSGGTAADMKATYDASGIPVKVDANAAIERHQVLHMPNVTGTIAFSPVRIVFGFALPATSRDPKGYVVREMDASDPDEYESEAVGGEN